MPVHLTLETAAPRGLDRREVARRARVIFGALQLGKAELSIVLTGDAQIHELNRTYRHKDRPTDVLAFAMREGEPGGGGDLLGDVMVDVETATRQAKKAGHPLMAEVTMLLAHGVLHLLGWDHETARKDLLMRAETARLVALATAKKKTPRATTQAPPRRSGKKLSAR